MNRLAARTVATLAASAVERTKADLNRSRREDELVAQIERQEARIRDLERELARFQEYMCKTGSFW